MSAHDEMTHNEPGVDISTRIGGSIQGWSGLGENIAMNQPDIQTVFIDWKNSPGHYANMVDPKFNLFGTAVTNGPNGRFWTQQFATASQGQYCDSDNPSTYTGGHTNGNAGAAAPSPTTTNPVTQSSPNVRNPQNPQTPPPPNHQNESPKTLSYNNSPGASYQGKTLPKCSKPNSYYRNRKI